jgi:hypothetical protein
MAPGPINDLDTKHHFVIHQAFGVTVLKDAARVMKPNELVNILNLSTEGRTLKNMADSKTRWHLMTKMAFGKQVDEKASENLRKLVLSSFLKNDWSWLPSVFKVKGLGNNFKKSSSIHMEKPAGMVIVLNSDLEGAEQVKFLFQQIGHLFKQILDKPDNTPTVKSLRFAAYLKDKR